MQNSKEISSMSNDTLVLTGCVIYLALLTLFNVFGYSWIMYIMVAYALFGNLIALIGLTASLAMLIYADDTTKEKFNQKRKEERSKKPAHSLIYHLFYLIYGIAIYHVYVFGLPLIAGIMIAGGISSYSFMLSKNVFGNG